MTEPKPQRVISVTARHRLTGAIETQRFRDPRMSKEDATAIFGMTLHKLGWKPEHVMITGCHAEKESATTMAIRNRLCGS